jgi:hypothetical protein
MPSQYSIAPRSLNPQHRQELSVSDVIKSGPSLSLSKAELPCLSEDQELFLGFNCDCRPITALRQARPYRSWVRAVHEAGIFSCARLQKPSKVAQK